MSVSDNISLQRDTLKQALCDIYDKLRHGILNGMLNEKTPRVPDDDVKSKCKNGHSRLNVRWSCGSVCENCDGISENCHASLEEHDLFKCMANIRKLIKEPDAEMPKISPSDFIPYEPLKWNYEVTPIWIARNIYKLCVGYWCFGDHSDKCVELAWRKAFDDTISIALGVYGKEFSTLAYALNNFTSEEDAHKFKREHPEVVDFVEKIHEQLDSIMKEHKSSENPIFDPIIDVQKKTTLLMAEMVTLRIEYRFGHDYPGGDVDVYSGVFSGIIDLCLVISGLYPNDRPDYLDFEDKEEYEKKRLVYDAEHKSKLYAFMSESDGITKIPLGE